jgi:hypothetical protein
MARTDGKWHRQLQSWKYAIIHFDKNIFAKKILRLGIK